MIDAESKVAGWKATLGIGTCLADGAGSGGGGAPGAADPAREGQPSSGGDAGGSGKGSGQAPAEWHSVTNWHESLPESLKGSEGALEAYKGKAMPEVLHGLLSNTMPPATPADYKLAIPMNPDGTPGTLREGVLEAMHAAKVPQAYLQAILNIEAQFFKADAEAARLASEKEAKEATDALKSRWGGDYDSRVAAVTRMLETLPEKLKERVTSSGIGSDTDFVELMWHFSRGQQEMTIHPGSGISDPGGSPAERMYGGTPAS